MKTKCNGIESADFKECTFYAKEVEPKLPLMLSKYTDLNEGHNDISIHIKIRCLLERIAGVHSL